MSSPMFCLPKRWWNYSSTTTAKPISQNRSQSKRLQVLGLLLSCHWLCLLLCAKSKDGKERIFDIVMDMAKSLQVMGEQVETKNTDFFVVVDKYFTLPKVVGEIGLWGVGIGCVETALVRKGWPPKPIAEVNDNRYNTLYHLSLQWQ